VDGRLSKEIEKIENMVRLEEAHATSLTESVASLNNIVVKEILRGIALDSKRHAGFFTATLSLLRGESQLIVESEYNRLEQVIKKHIEVESRMMLEVKNLLDAEKDSRVKHLLTEIFEDEVRHHAIMKRMLEAVIRRETIFEEDVWDMMWKDVPGHGVPLG
jgi:rubrerythrin